MPSLNQAFKMLNIDAVLSALESNFLSSASLKGMIRLNAFVVNCRAEQSPVLSTTGHSDNISHVTVALVNNFIAGL